MPRKSKREQQRINTTKSRFGKDAFRKWGGNGGKISRKKSKVA